MDLTRWRRRLVARIIWRGSPKSPTLTLSGGCRGYVRMTCQNAIVTLVSHAIATLVQLVKISLVELVKFYPLVELVKF